MTKSPPKGAPKHRLQANETEGFEGIIDRIIQGTFTSVDNEIENFEFVELDKAALEMNEDLNETKITKRSLKLAGVQNKSLMMESFDENDLMN